VHSILTSVLLLLIISISACATREATFVEFTSGEVLKGKFADNGDTNGKIKVVMPNGETLKGRYLDIPNHVKIAFTRATTKESANRPPKTSPSFSSEQTGDNQRTVYALLTSTRSDSKTVMEIIATYRLLDGGGVGEARTNDGRNYNILF